ncbi:DUF2157 domain-containing protein [Paludifilum halophilum]|nr:DUF2157 domain-containing protein [Paludifilum halophilum]
MSRRWLEKEGEAWVEDGILTREQLQRILDRYPSGNRAAQTLPILAGVLTGLGILSWVASHWEEISPLIRLTLLITTLIGFYTAGEYQAGRGRRHIGASLTALGVVSFGGSMVLIGQMYHVTAHDARLWILWAIAGLFSLALYRHPFLFFLNFVILTASQLFSTHSYGEFSFVTAALFLLGIGGYAQRQGSSRYTWTATVGGVFQAILWISSSDLSSLWIFPLMLGWYALGDSWASPRWERPIKTVSLGVAFALCLFLSLEPIRGESLPPALIFTGGTALLWALSLIARIRSKRWKDLYEWVLFLPLFYLTQGFPEAVHTSLYLLLLLGFSLAVLLTGYARGSRRRTNGGITLFLIATFTAYLNLTWDFMPKSLFFLLGGLLLFALNHYLQRTKRDRLSQGGEAK